MTKRQALMILFRHAAANCRGVGCGIRSLPSDEERAAVTVAVQKLYPEATGRPLSDSDRFNMGLPFVLDLDGSRRP